MITLSVAAFVVAVAGRPAIGQELLRPAAASTSVRLSDRVGTAPAPRPFDAPIANATVLDHLAGGPIEAVQFSLEDAERLGFDTTGDAGPSAATPYGLERIETAAERTPADLKKIGSIEPFLDYTPEGEICDQFCPRPAECPEPVEGQIATQCPAEQSLGDERHMPRAFMPRDYMWAASNVYSRPLYFEDYVLERHGHTYGDEVQPFVSLGLFSFQLIGLPYQMAIDRPLRPIYAAGAVRPGDPATKRTPQVPWNTKAAAAQAGALSGAGLFLP